MGAAAASKRNSVIIRTRGAYCGKQNGEAGDHEQGFFSGEQGINSREQAVWRDGTAISGSLRPRDAEAIQRGVDALIR